LGATLKKLKIILDGSERGHRWKTSLVLGWAAACGGDDAPTGPAEAFLLALDTVPVVGSPGRTLIDTLRVRLVDGSGAPLAGRSVIWSIVTGGGTVDPLAERTDANGISSARWTLGPRPGQNAVQASAEAEHPVRFQTSGEAFRVDMLDSNYGFACGLREGDVWCWGQENWPDTVGTSEDYAPPTRHAHGLDLVDLAAGDRGFCGLDAAGAVWCGGAGHTAPRNQSHTVRDSAVLIGGLPPLRTISGDGDYEYCGVARGDSTGWCWTDATVWQLSGPERFQDLRLGSSGWYLDCGLLTDSTAVCGNTAAGFVSVQGAGAHHFATLAVGDEFACGLKPNSEVWCWGANGRGQLGSPGPDSPVPVFAIGNVTRLAAEWMHVMVVRHGTVERWGGGDRAGEWAVPSLAGLPVSDFAANDVSCARLFDGQAYCFEELWLNSSSLDIDLYLAVHPLAGVP